MSTTTKELIMSCAVNLFNRYGVAAVKMRDIADAAGISIGNLTYHFPRKKDLILAIHDSQLAYRKKIFAFPKDIDFQGFADYLSASEHLRTTNSYFFDNFIDLSRMYKEIFITQQRIFKEMVNFMSSSLNSFVRKGLIVPEAYPGHYTDMANGLVTVTTFWGHYQAFMPMGVSYMKNTVWSIILPCMTEAGIEEYQKVIVPTLNGQEI